MFMGPIAYSIDHDGRLKKCSEKRLTCDESQNNTDGCCAIVACRYCVTWEEYGEAAVSDMTDNGAGTWTATPGGVTFVMTWERDQYTDECELVVTFDGEEVYRQPCYDQSCRDSSDEVEVDTGYLVGTLRWVKDLKRPLPNVRDYETNCIRQMCADCNCTCECLCVTITEYDGAPIATGEICDTAYDCDPPVWEGTVGDYEIVIALDEECVLTATVNGYAESIELEQYTSVCDNFTATITLDDGTIITVTCKECTCVAGEFACCPNIGTPAALYLTLRTISMVCGCLDGEVITMLPNGTLSGRLFYQAIWQWTCPDPFFPENIRWFKFDTSCQAGDAFPTIEVRTLVQLDTDPDPLEDDPDWGTINVYYYDDGQCDPFYFHYNGTLGADAVWVRCQDDFMDNPEIQMELTV